MADKTETQLELISVVMPVYREGAHLATVLAAVRDAITKTGHPFEFVIVDDGSPDDTWQVLHNVSDEFPMMRAFRLSRNFGKESALRAGIEMTRGEAVIVMDGDGQHPPALIPEMIRTWQEAGVDIVDGVKASRGIETMGNKLGSKVFYRSWSRLSGFDLTGASDFKLLNRRAVNAYLQLDERNLFFRGMTAWLGFRRARVPFEVAGRAGGGSGWSWLGLIRLALTGITAFSAVPLQIITVAGALFMLFAVAFGLQTLYVFLVGHAVSGFATVIVLLLIIGSLLMISLGVIGEYLARIYDEVKRRPRFLVGEVIDPAIKDQKG